MKNKLYGALLVLVLAAFGAARASAQVDVSPGVARVSLIHGDVSTQRGDSQDWSAAALNQPVVTGDKVSTGADSRAELQLDYANILRLADNSQASLANLADKQIQIQVGQGLIDYTVLKGSEANVEIDTPNVAVHPDQREGVYRIEINSDGETRVIVRKGAAEISTPQGSTRVEAGAAATIRGTGDQTAYKIEDAQPSDSWDSWNNDRDNVISKAQSWSHTNRYYTGSEDLDAYGRWVNVPDYGAVWMPTAGPDWVPYRDGRWVYEPYWGWTWVSYEPWGWAPYHYGRWFVYGGSWAWWPGPVYQPYRPIWAPAYVSFFGFGSNWGVSAGFGFGSVGWLPCGPGDRFFPWYGRYGSRFNVVNVTNITNVYNFRNRTTGGFPPLRSTTGVSNLRMINSEPMRRALSTVPADRFGTGRITATPASREMLRNGRLVDGNLPVVPSRASLSASNRAANPSTIRGGQQRFFEKARPAAAQPFDRQVSQLQQSIQRDGKFTPIRAAGNEGLKPSPAIESRTSVQNPRNTVQPASSVAHMPTRIGVAEASPGAAARPGMNPGRSAEVPKPEANRGGVVAENPARSENPARTASTPQPERGWQRFGSPIAQNNAPQSPQQQRSVPRPSSPATRIEQPNNARPATQDQSGWRNFGGNSQGGNRSTPPMTQNGNRGGAMNVPRPPESRGQTSPASPAREASPNRSDGWRQFSPESRSPAPENRGGFSQGNRFPSASEPRNTGSSRSSGDFSRNSRPPLNLQRPIVTPRSYNGMGGQPGYRSTPPSGGGYHSAPSGGGYRGAPSSAPRGNSGGGAPHGGGGGQPHSGGRH